MRVFACVTFCGLVCVYTYVCASVCALTYVRMCMCVHILHNTGVQLIVREYDFTAQPTFSEGDIFNILPVVKTTMIKVSHASPVDPPIL